MVNGERIQQHRNNGGASFWTRYCTLLTDVPLLEHLQALIGNQMWLWGCPIPASCCVVILCPDMVPLRQNSVLYFLGIPLKFEVNCRENHQKEDANVCCDVQSFPQVSSCSPEVVFFLQNNTDIRPRTTIQDLWSLFKQGRIHLQFIIEICLWFFL